MGKKEEEKRLRAYEDPEASLDEIMREDSEMTLAISLVSLVFSVVAMGTAFLSLLQR